MQRGPQRDERPRARTAQIDPLEHAPVWTPDLERLHLDARRDDGVEQSQLAQRGKRVRGKRERETQFARTGGAFDDADAPAGAAQRDRRGQPADPRADDEGGATQD